MPGPDAPILSVSYQTALSAPATVLHFNGGTQVSHTFAGTGTDSFPTGALTIAFWAHTPSTSANAVLCTFTPSGATAPRLTLSNPTNLTLTWQGATPLVIGHAINDGSWHQVLVTIAPNGRTRAALQVVLDGVVAVQNPNAFTHAATDWFTAAGALSLGLAGAGTGFTGEMSELQLWNSALSDVAAATLLQRRAAAGATGLVLVWALYDASTSGIITGGDPNPFVASSLQFRVLPGTQAAYVQANWPPVSGASGYDFDLYATNGTWIYSATNVQAASLPLNIDGVPLGQAYYARARSRTASGPGAWSTPVALVPIDLAGMAPAFQWSAATSPLYAGWQSPDQAPNAQMLQTRDPLQSPAPTPQIPANNPLDISADLTGDYGWTIGLQALAQGSVGPSLPAAPVTAPAVTFYYVDTGGAQGSFEFTWTSLPQTPSYFYVQVSKGTTPILTQLLPGTQTSPVLLPSPQPLAVGDTVTGVLRMIGNSAITHITSRTVTVQNIARPQIAWQIAASPQAEAFAMGWGTVAAGATYNIALFQDSGTTPIDQKTGVADLAYAMTSYLSVVPPHSYTLQVNAVVGGEIGPPNQVVAAPVPGSRIAYVWSGAPTNTGALTISWTPASTPGLQLYLRQFLNGATTPSTYGAVGFAAGTFTVTQPQGGYPEGTQFAYQAYALADGSMGAGETGSVTLHRLDVPVVTLTGDPATLALTAQWPAVDPQLTGVQYQILVNGAQVGSTQAATSYVLTSYLDATAAAAFQVCATLDNSFSTPSVAAQPGPVAATLRYQYALNSQDTLTASWNSAPIVYAKAQQSGQTQLALQQLILDGSTSRTIAPPAGGFTEGAVYTLSAKAIDQSTVGAFAQATATIHQLAQPTMTFAQAADPASVTAQWNDIRNAQQQGLAVLYQVQLNAHDQGAPQSALSLTIASLLDQAGAQSVTVQGQAEGSYGIWSAPPSLATPATPTVSFDAVTQQLIAIWPSAQGVQQYYANATDGSGTLLGRNWIGAPPATVTTQFAVANPMQNTSYTVKARALAGGALTAFASASVTYLQVPGPSIAPLQDDAANDRIIASWSFDPAACGLTNVTYVAELHDASGALIGTPVTTTSATAPLPYPASTPNGTMLQVRVRATGNGMLGFWSQYASVAVGSALRKVTIVSFAFNAQNAMTLSWGAVPSPQSGTAVTYTVNVTGPGLKTGVFPQTTNATSITLGQDVTGVGNQQKYTATVQATGPGTPGPASDPVNATTGTLQPPDPGGGGGDHGGDPIAMATGEYGYSNVDIAVAAVMPLQFATYYSSAAPLPDPQNPVASDKPLGKRWNHAYNTRLYIPNPQPATNPYVAIAWGDGPVSSYTGSNTVGGLPKQGRQDGSVLSRNADLSYTLLLKDQTRYNFDASGRLLTIVSNVGNVITLSYQGGQLTRVTDNGSGRYLALAYFTTGADTGRLRTVTDNAGRQVSYAYTNGDLTSMTNARGKSRTFTYWPQSLLKQANAESGDVIVYNEYDGQQRVQLQKDGNQAAGGQATYRIVWSTGTGPNNLATTIATVTDYAGHQIVYTSLTESQDTIGVVTTLANGNVYSVSTTYDGNGNVLSQTTYEGPSSGVGTLGNTVSMTYDGNFNLLTLTYSGMASASFAYDSRNNLTQYTDVLGNVTTSTFNPDNTMADTRDALGARTVYTYKPGAICGLVETISTYPADGQGGTSATANVTQLTYTGQGELQTVTNPLGETSTTTYDSTTGRAQSGTVADADGTVTFAVTYEDDPQSGQAKTLKTQRYNQPLADASTEAYTYDDRGNVQTVTDALGRTTQYVYNPNNFLKTIIYPPQNGLSQQTGFDYTGDNLINTLTLSSASPAVVWQFTYDAVGRLATRTDPSSAVTTFGYVMNAQPSQPAPTVKSVVLPLLAGETKPYVQSMTSDAIGRQLALTDITVQGTTGGTTTLGYQVQTDPTTKARMLQLTKTLPPESPTQGTPYTEVLVFDAYNRVISRTTAAGKTWTTAFSLRTTTDPVTVQSVATITDPLGNQTITVTDAAGRVVERRVGKPAQGTTPAVWKITAFSYDSYGNPEQVIETGTDGVAAPATMYAYSYDAQAHVLNVTVTPYGQASAASVYSYDKTLAYFALRAPNGVTESRTYNSRGFLSRYVDARGNSLQYSYDAAGRFVTTQLPGSQTVTQVLDANGNRLQTTLNGTVQITRTFDTLNRLATRTDNVIGKTVGYKYTPMNKVATLTYPDVANPLVYTYDGLQRLQTVTDWSARQTSYTYLPDGQLRSTTYPNGLTVSCTIDDAGRSTGYSATLNSAVLASCALQLDPLGRPQTIDEVLPMGSNAQSPATYTYDADRLLTVNAAAVAYDADGDIAGMPGVTGTLQYNALRQLTAVGAATLTYDLDGLHTGLINAASTLQLVKDPRDYRAPLVEIADPTQSVDATNVWSSESGPLSIAPLPPRASEARPLSLLPSRPPTLGPEQPDPFESLPMPAADPCGDYQDTLDRTLIVRSPDGASWTRYVYGIGLISREDAAGNWRSYVFDQQGSALALVDASGAVTDRFVYAPYGRVIAQQSTSAEIFRYNGGYGAADFGIGPVLMRFRPYWPGMRRFSSRDLLFGSTLQPQTQNRYSFVLGNPLYLIDPLGLGGDHGGGGGGRGGGLSGGAIAGIVIGGVVLAGAAVAYFFGPAIMTALGEALVAQFGRTALGQLGRRILARFPPRGFQQLVQEIPMEEIPSTVVPRVGDVPSTLRLRRPFTITE